METRQLTYGEKAVGITFNPGKNETVERIKRHFANTIDALNYEREAELAGERRSEVVRMLSVAITEAQTAQMWAVKAVTWQY